MTIQKSSAFNRTESTNPSMKPTTNDVRTKGQVWTPPWVADAMAIYVLADSPNVVHDPSLGSGSLAVSVANVAQRTGRVCDIVATELHPDHIGGLEEHLEGLGCNLEVIVGDFLDEANDGPINAIIANPPYVRHHRFNADQKSKLQSRAQAGFGISVDGRTGYHVFFLARALERMNADARAAFILPSDVFEGISSRAIMTRLTELCNVEGVARFEAVATPFPKVDTNPVVIFFRKGGPTIRIACATIRVPETDALLQWVAAGFPTISTTDIVAYGRTREESLETGLTRDPRDQETDLVRLGELLKTSRGIATGDNAYFTMTESQMRATGIPPENFRRCVGRTKDIDGEELDLERLDQLDSMNRATYLLDVRASNKNEMDDQTRAYIERGEAKGVTRTTLAASRSIWWRMDRREIPPILFSYLGRGSSRFYRNRSGAVPLNGFIGVYPQNDIDPDALCRLLADERTVKSLRYEAKTYGRGDIKIEPNAIERVTVPRSLVENHGIVVAPRQGTLF